MNGVELARKCAGVAGNLLNAFDHRYGPLLFQASRGRD